MIKIMNLEKTLGLKKAIDIPSLTIPSGSIFAFLGVNGSGKSTFLRLLCGVYQPDSGEIFYNGKSLKKPRLRKDFLYISDDLLSKNESLDSLYLFYSTFYGMKKAAYEKYLKLFDIDRKDKQLRHYSKGMKRRVYLSIALAISPKVLVLDEAFDGLDILGKTLFKKEIVESMTTDPERTVIIASHSIKEVEGLIDGYAVLKKGKVILSSATESGENYRKIEVGFKDEFDFTKLTEEGFTVLKSSAKVATVCTNKSETAALAILQKYEPALVEVGELTMEELFCLKSEQDVEENNHELQ